MKDICCIGHITLDKIITPDHEFEQNGGTSFYFAYGINQLPQKVSFQLVTSMADKDMKAVDDMRRAGIDVVCHKSRETVFFENKYGHNQNNRTQKVRAKSDPFTVGQLEGLEARVFHLGTLLADDFAPEVVELAVLKHTDILKLNEHEMEVVTGLTNPRDVARQIADWGVREVVITLGSYGSLIYADGQYYEIPAYAPRQAVDATGCGDTYSTGYLYCRAQGMNYLESGKFAAAMCTLKLEHSGPFDGTIDDIQQLVNAG